MPKYRWTIEFDAEDDKDADAQIEEALQAFHSYHVEDVQQIDEGGDAR